MALDRGANIHAKDDAALRWAAGNGHYNVVKFLLDNGANVYAWDNGALRWTINNGHKDIIKLLKSYMSKTTNKDLNNKVYKNIHPKDIKKR